MPNFAKSWFIIFIWYLFHWSRSAYSSPAPSHIKPKPERCSCAHDSITDLIKTSPVILKASGTLILNNDNLNKLVTVDEKSKCQKLKIQNDSFNVRKTTNPIDGKEVKGDSAAIYTLPHFEESNILLFRLTPETIFKGSSVLKTGPASYDWKHNSESQYENHYNYIYERNDQLYGILYPLSCFKRNWLNFEPTKIIVFGKWEFFPLQLNTTQEVNENFIGPTQISALVISNNGLHRWSQQFENFIWKTLGWDEWSDFTVCSVTCGKGVQQRFRRCRLDNPMINLNNNMHITDLQSFDDDDVFALKKLKKKKGNKLKFRRNLKRHRSIIEKRVSKIKNIKRNSIKSRHELKTSMLFNKFQTKRKRQKLKKGLRGMECEGYNIEERNCNSFECHDDIIDLLQYFKKLSMVDKTTNSLKIYASSNVNNGYGETLANTGFIKKWCNTLNYTVMITLRTKDNSETGTIFSIRNATHNMYMEPSREGLRLYLEIDNSTEMLLAKFNLYDYYWHQVAFSMQNGDFISIYIDCSWIKSFVISQHLFGLPTGADIEVGRGFNGELQQLLIMPGNQQQYQCSSKLTSINEIKRYIIDTFIDYA